MKKILGIILAMLVVGKASSQNLIIFSENEKTLSLNVPATFFFKNNEYKRQIAYGYTLGGVRAIPNLEYQPLENLSISAGVNVLRYWGADEYGQYNFISVPYYCDSNTQKQLHLKPFFRINWQINPRLNLIMGNLYIDYYHYLPIALYNREFSYSSDGEEGVQLIYTGEYWTNDAWANWQNFNFYNDVDRESFDVGISGTLNTSQEKKYIGYADYSFIWHHNGGELDTITTLYLDHWANGHLGLRFRYNNICNKQFDLTLSLNYLFSKDMKNSTLPFKKGHAWFPSLEFSFYKGDIMLGYYDSKDMITFYGTNFFSNLAQRTQNVTYPHNRMLYASVNYNISLNKRNTIYNSAYNLAVVGEIFYKLDSENSMGKEDNSLSFGLGLIFYAQPRFRIYKFKNFN